jgi:putative ABC transport system permease protein
MLKNYLVTAWRSLVRRKSYTFINVLGLAVGIAAALLIFLVVSFESSFETFRPGYRQIYHVVTIDKWENGYQYNPGVPQPLTEALRVAFPQAKVAALDKWYGGMITVPHSDGQAATANRKFTENVGLLFIEAQFFDIFKTRWFAGGPDALIQPDKVVLDKTTAAKYFGDWKTAMGRTVILDNLLNLQVAGIIEDARPNTDFQFKVLVSFPTWKQRPMEFYYNPDWQWTSSDHQVFMQLPQGVSADNIDAQLKQMSRVHAVGKIVKTQYLQPLSEMHFDTKIGFPLGDHLTDRNTIRILSSIALLIILMASINFINLSTAQSVGRSKEVGIRKVLGSSRGLLIRQVLLEMALVVAGAVVLAVGLAFLFLPSLRTIAGIPVEVPLLSKDSVIFLVLIVVIVTPLSGIYPAMVLSGFKPVQALKNKISAATVGGVSLRRGLVVVQFAISQLLVIATIVTLKQLHHIHSADLGFNKDAILVIQGRADSASQHKMKPFKDELLTNADVQSVSFVSDVPCSGNNRGSKFHFDHSPQENGWKTFLKMGDTDYFKTFGLQLIAGRGYGQSDTPREVVVNETFLRTEGITDAQMAIGKTIQLGTNPQWLPIVGVVKDFRTNSMREDIKPIVLTAKASFESQLAIKIRTPNLSKTVAELQKRWQAAYPEYDYSATFLDESIAQFYQQEDQLSVIYRWFAGVAIFISCLGLYGLVAFTVTQKTREIGVRKVLGASVRSIVVLFSREFMVLITVSFVLAAPLGWYFMNGWLQSFVSRTVIGIDVFLPAIIGSMVLAWLSVGYKAISAAYADPVKSLRSEG